MCCMDATPSARLSFLTASAPACTVPCALARRTGASVAPLMQEHLFVTGGFVSTTLQTQLQPRIVESPVHAELRDAAAVDEAAEADVSGHHLPVRVGVEDVVATDGEAHATAQLVGQIEVEQRRRPEVLVACRTSRCMILDRAVVARASEPREPAEGVA